MLSKSTVAVIGTNGALGQKTIDALTSSLFEDKIAYPIHVVTKSKQGKAESDRVRYFEIDHDASAEELSKAFVGTQFVVDLTAKIADHGKIIDAAILAKDPKVFIPSEFGTYYEDIPYHVFDFKKVVVEKAVAVGLKVVKIRSSLFADWNIARPFAFGVNLEGKKATIIEDGNTKVSVTFLADLAKVIASIVATPLDKLPSNVNIQSDSVTAMELIEIFESATGEKIQVEHISLEDAQKRTLDIEKNGGVKDYYEFTSTLQTIGAEKVGLNFTTKNDNELVNPGLFEWTKFKGEAQRIWKNYYKD